MDPTDKLFCYPEKNDEKRFVLGRKGKRNLLCIGLNPNKANIDGLDLTSLNVQRTASDNNYDGWILINLYPRRKPKAGYLEDKNDKKLFWENIRFVSALLSPNNFGIKNVWLAWGDGIEERIYFKESILQLYSVLKKHKFYYWAFSVNHSGNPTHPSPLVINTRYKRNALIKLSEFNFDVYVETVKSKQSSLALH